MPPLAETRPASSASRARGSRRRGGGYCGYGDRCLLARQAFFGPVEQPLLLPLLLLLRLGLRAELLEDGELVGRSPPLGEAAVLEAPDLDAPGRNLTPGRGHAQELSLVRAGDGVSERHVVLRDGHVLGRHLEVPLFTPSANLSWAAMF